VGSARWQSQSQFAFLSVRFAGGAARHTSRPTRAFPNELSGNKSLSQVNKRAAAGPRQMINALSERD
jgi:hypothetical protein